LEIRPDVFLVEDDQLLASALSVQIEMLGYRVAGTADTAQCAVDAVLACPPHVVIMDINLSGGETGLDAARAIRRECEVPIIFYTACGGPAVREQIAQMGNAQLLEKPVPEDALGEALSNSLSWHSPRAPVLAARRIGGK
jgi:CheY-like chemotaxis protein